MKLRYFYKLDQKKQPIPGSNVRRKSKPSGHQWKEILDPCCSPSTVDCTCSHRFFVQLDGAGKPVDHTLIKRKAYPEMTEGVRYYEIPWKSPCCGQLTWTFLILDGVTGTFTIKKNGVIQEVTAITGTSGTFNISDGDVIEITLTNTAGVPLSIVDVLKESDNTTTSSDDTITPFVYSFVAELGNNYTVTGTIRED